MDKKKKILEQLGDEIVYDAKKNLKRRKKDKRSSGDLRRSLKSTVDSDGNTLTIYGEDYAEYVDQGTKDSKGNYFLTDAVDDNLNKFADKIADAIGDDILGEIDIIIK